MATSASKYIVSMPKCVPVQFDILPTVLSNDEYNQLDLFEFINNELFKNLESATLLVKFDEFLERFPNCDLKRLKGIFEIAVEKKQLALCLYIIQKKPGILEVVDETPCIITAAKMNDAQLSFIIVRNIISTNKKIVNLSTPNGITALSETSSKKTHKKVTKLLLEEGGVVYKEIKDGPEAEFAEEILATQMENIRKALS